MGKHLDEFAEYKDSMGRSFDQLVCNALHRRGPRLVEAPQPKLERLLHARRRTLSLTLPQLLRSRRRLILMTTCTSYSTVTEMPCERV
jgi:hypothetical protein